jgi:uncharacterized phage protein (TIGR02220 family)
MKWFKHYSNASNDAAINRLEEDFGHLGYAAYWKILEICADKWDGSSDPVFTLNKKLIQNKLRTKSKQTGLVMVSLSLSKLYKVTETDFDYVIEIPNLLKIKDNHTKNLPVASKLLASNLPQEQNRTDKTRTDKSKKAKTKVLETAFYEVEKPTLEETEKVLPIESNILTHLNAVCSSSYRPSKKTISLIKARLAEGFTFDDFKRVIEFKNSQWQNSEMANYLRPETLFGNKFEGYLQASNQITGPMSEAEVLKLAEQLYADAFGKKEA